MECVGWSSMTIAPKAPSRFCLITSGGIRSVFRACSMSLLVSSLFALTFEVMSATPEIALASISQNSYLLEDSPLTDYFADVSDIIVTMKKWSAIILLAIAQFIMVLDSTVMNVSISAVVKDLDTTVADMQMAITFFTLTMAAFMLTGGKLGDILGHKKAFLVGISIYGVGSLITALSPNIQTLMLGWSLVEGLGAVLVIPAVASLVAVRYEGKDRVKAFAVIGAVAGSAAAAGPLIGGFVTTFLSWRYVFAFEAVAVILILLFAKLIPSVQKAKSTARIDIASVVSSASGMALLIFGVLQGKVWGWVEPMTIPQIAGIAIAPLGVSVVTYLIFAGTIVLLLFVRRQHNLVQAGKEPLLDMSLLRIPQLRSGLGVLLSQYLVVGSMFFIVPIYLQFIIGLNPLDTGLHIIPLSFTLILFSMLGSRAITFATPRQIIYAGQVCLIIGVAVLVTAINPQLTNLPFTIGMLVIGSGLGLLASQLGNINMNTVDKRHSSEVGGLQGTAQNIGSSLGTALIGSILIMTLSSGFAARVNSNSSISPQIQTAISQKATLGIPIVSTSEVAQIAQQQGLSPTEASTVEQDYTSAQLEGLKRAMVFLLLLSIFSLFLSRDIPNRLIASKSK